MRRQALFCVSVLAAALVAELAIARLLAGRDVLARLVAHFDLWSAFLLLTLLGLRLFLFTCGPGWVLWLIARTAENRWRRRRELAP
jgi:hypothetical protein